MNFNESASSGHDIHRITSIDIFRGLTVLLMVFVDNLAFVDDLPSWTYHMRPHTNGMTYVDMVFPAFLFVMGMSIPLSVDRRLAEGESRARIFLHIVTRSLSLVALGVFIANDPQVDRQHTGISAASWALLGFAGIALFWSDSPATRANKPLRSILKYSGLLLLLILAIVFRRTTPDGYLAWLDFSDWEILGLLGWTYLLAASFYLLFKKNVPALAASLIVFCALNVISVTGRFHWLAPFPSYAQPFEAGLASITMAGLLASLIFFDDARVRTFRAKALVALGYAAFLACAAFLLMPLGVSKLRDTPSWCLYCSAANTLLFLLLYWIADVKRWGKWLGFATVAGVNALLAYLVAYVAYFNPALFRLTADGTEEWYGVLRSFLFVALVLITTAVLARFKFRLRL